ncbi:MAG: molybdate ABC transporter substrate-binding protein [Candidatus Omnitrophica bacterium]|nr:molybdate ABC transporter substrate-binding protein [Candidatus Omnitrophota bacterium]
MKKRGIIIIIFLLTIISIAYYLNRQQANSQKVLTIYVPCGMTIPFKELSLAYEKQYHLKVEPVFDNSNILVRLVLDKGKIPDLFVSPGKKEIGLLKEKGFINEDSIRPFAKYELILIAPAKSDYPKAISDLLSDAVKTIVISNPDFNSIGAYAVESLKSLGLWERIEKKVIFTNTPIEALSYIAISKADAGIHYNICPFETNTDKVEQGAIRIIAQFPSDSHEIINSYIAILRDSKFPEEARNFQNFMFSKKGLSILSQYGLQEPSFIPKAVNEIKESQKVIVEAYYPFNEEHIFMKGYLESLKDKYKGKVNVECIDFRNDEGYVRWRKTGLSCGGILINGKNKFTLNVEGKPKEIEFIKRMDIFWKKADLENAIQQELERVDK